ncbi:winged helix-turn-helix domain-containing protein [Arenibaculum pallidiluteum]|uniref:winged helix-turn-helix domain-containing protein n=1 Tax=Arenibaculum pallidiluteum TaxID=2812559 RepID=UPI001A97569D|nr:winged helix-turn-helix domain-containing protein [Arenibaculum pallidiluteum]
MPAKKPLVAVPAPIDSLSAAEARRVAIAAQGLAEARPRGAPGARHLRRVLARIGLLQIDSVNVLARAHYLPLFSRLGPYAQQVLDEAAWGPRRRRLLFEYWAHEASLLPLETQPLLRWRMERAARGEGIYGGLARFGRERPDYIAAVLAEVAARGPLSAADLSEGGRASGSWWGWSDGKRALEWLFWAGQVTTATRRGAFERVYDLTTRVLPPAISAAPTPPVEEAQRALLRIAAGALGIATERDLRDYFRMEPAETRARLAELVEAGALLPVRIEGWDQQAYLDPGARVPRRVAARALLAPFDPLVWERSRAERLFGFRYRLEIYTPAHKREHGYYVLPFLLGERMAARLDLKADRGGRRLLVHAAHGEPGTPPARTIPALAGELHAMARWLGLETVVVADAGDLAQRLRAAVAAPAVLADPAIPSGA